MKLFFGTCKAVPNFQNFPGLGHRHLLAEQQAGAAEGLREVGDEDGHQETSKQRGSWRNWRCQLDDLNGWLCLKVEGFFCWKLGLGGEFYLTCVFFLRGGCFNNFENSWDFGSFGCYFMHGLASYFYQKSSQCWTINRHQTEKNGWMTWCNLDVNPNGNSEILVPADFAILCAVQTWLESQAYPNSDQMQPCTHSHGLKLVSIHRTECQFKDPSMFYQFLVYPLSWCTFNGCLKMWRAFHVSMPRQLKVTDPSLVIKPSLSQFLGWPAPPTDISRTLGIWTENELLWTQFFACLKWP